MNPKLTFKNITQPDPKGYQVRIVRRGQETSRYFSHRQWGGQKRALAAANSWRDQVKVALKKTMKRPTKALKNNKSTGVQGVCKTHSCDRRKGLKYLVYSVGWTDYTGKKRTTAFRVCNVRAYDREMDLLAFASAKQFRKEWEHHADNDTLHLFEPSQHLNWRKEGHVHEQ